MKIDAMNLSTIIYFISVITTTHLNVRNANSFQFPSPSTNNLQSSALRSSSDDDTGSSGTLTEMTSDRKKKRVVIVGGGWAGFTAANTLSSDANHEQADIILLDASPRGKGGLAGGWRTPSGRPVEAGIHGFWREYRNTFAVMESIPGVELEDVLTPYTPSVLFSKSGKVAVAPVLKEEDDTISDDVRVEDVIREILRNPFSPENILNSVAPLLPPPLDIALLSEFSPTSSPLTPLDRLSAIGLLPSWADFQQESPESWKRYDSISASDLFLKYAGVSSNLYRELVSPLLHVLPMTPGYDCSAAAALSCFHVFALQSKGAFDVRWCRGGIGERVFNPWAECLVERGVDIRGGTKVTSVETDEEGTVELILNGGEESLTCDAVVFAVGGTAMGRLSLESPMIAELPNSKDFGKCRGVTCVAVRLFLKPDDIITEGLKGGFHHRTQLPPNIAEAMIDSPVAVCGAGVGGISRLEETGFCIYDLQRLHDEFSVKDKSTPDDVAVLEVDYFRADPIADMESDAEIADFALETVYAAFGLDFKKQTLPEILDLSVVRARNAVSHFAVRSAIDASPPVTLGKNVYMCGDWIDRTGHASWSTEKAVVTGKQAASAVASDLGLECRDGTVIPAVEDTGQLEVLRKVAGVLRNVIPPPGEGIPASPWAFARNVINPPAADR